MQFISKNYQETFDFGFMMGSKAKINDIYCLNGDLGAGKTVFTKGFAKALGITEEIVSPTFAIANVYESGKIKLNHLDLYRITNMIELENIGFYEYLEDAITIIEWSKNIGEIPESIDIDISYIDLNTRMIKVSE